MRTKDKRKHLHKTQFPKRLTEHKIDIILHKSGYCSRHITSTLKKLQNKIKKPSNANMIYIAEFTQMGRFGFFVFLGKNISFDFNKRFKTAL